MSDRENSPAQILEERLRLGAGFGAGDRGHVLEISPALGWHLAHWSPERVDLEISVNRSARSRLREPASGFLNARFELWTGRGGAVGPGGDRHARAHRGATCVWARGGDGSFDLLICDAAYTPRHYAEPGSDKALLRAGQ
jgi:hypothetical protein